MVDPDDPRAVSALERYLAEVQQALSTPGASLTHEVESYRPPHGCFLLLLEDEVLGCGGLRTLAPGVGEIKRMWIAPGARGRGLGAALLTALEEQARSLGMAVVRLDTNEGLTPAIELYTSRGYAPIARYNDNPDATHFFEKVL